MSATPRRPRRVVMTLAGALILGLAGLATPGPAEASFLGDPTLTNGAGRFGIGAELDFVFDRDIDFDVGPDGGLDTNRVFFTGSYGFLQNLDGFVKIGLFNGEVDPGGVDIDTGFGIGGGARGTFLRRGDWRFGALAQIMFFSSELDTPFNQDIDWLEVDLAGAVSYRGLGQIVPYGGIKLGFVSGEIDPGVDFDQDDVVGIFGGASVAITPNFTAGAELRLIDESAIGFYARYTF